MNKTEFIAAVAAKEGLEKKTAEKAVNAYNTLKDWGMQLSLGSVTSKPCEATAAENYSDRIFALTPSEVSQREAREGRNPRTGETIDVPACKVPAFKAGKGLKDKVAK